MRHPRLLRNLHVVLPVLMLLVFSSFGASQDLSRILNDSPFVGVMNIDEESSSFATVYADEWPLRGLLTRGSEKPKKGLEAETFAMFFTVPHTLTKLTVEGKTKNDYVFLVVTDGSSTPVELTSTSTGQQRTYDVSAFTHVVMVMCQSLCKNVEYLEVEGETSEKPQHIVAVENLDRLKGVEGYSWESLNTVYGIEFSASGCSPAKIRVPYNAVDHGVPVETNRRELCVPCLNGTGVSERSGNVGTVCEACALGRYANEGLCEDCPLGSYSDGTGWTSCKACVKAYTVDVGSTACIQCQDHEVVVENECTTCKPGFAGEPGSNLCVPCGRGTYANGTPCQNCPLGYYGHTHSGAVHDGCAPCSATENEECVYCPWLNEEGSCEFCDNSIPWPELQDRESWTTYKPLKDCLPPVATCGEGQIWNVGCTSCPATFIQINNTCGICPAGEKASAEGKCLPTAVGKYSSEWMSGNAVCEGGQIPKGGNAEGVGHDHCEYCVPGKFASEGDLECSECPDGSYSADYGSTICGQCSELEVVSADKTECVLTGDCIPGTYRNEAEECARCPINTYKTTTGNETCTPCPDGTFQNDVGRTECFECTPGFFSVGADCQACPLGRYSDSDGLSACTKCDTGYFSEAAYSSCRVCGVGSVSASQGASACDLCEAGLYSTGGGKVCTNCGVGRYNTINGLSGCFDCPKGTYANDEDNTACLSCPLGRFNSEEGQSLSACIPCSPGTYSDEMFASVCQQCSGQYQPEMGQTACISCPPNSQMGDDPDLSTRTSCFCDIGFYGTITENGGNCTECDESSRCDEVGLPLPLSRPGFFIVEDPTTTEQNGTFAVFECRPKEACSGNSTEGAQCASGYEGLGCRYCVDEPPHYRLKESCYSCDGNGVRFDLVGLVFFVIFLFYILPTLVLLLATIIVGRNIKNDPTSKFRIWSYGFMSTFVNTSQLLGMFLFLSHQWPFDLELTLKVFSFFDLNVQVLRPECMMKGTVTDSNKYVVACLLPLLFLTRNLFLLGGYKVFNHLVRTYGTRLQRRYPLPDPSQKRKYMIIKWLTWPSPSDKTHALMVGSLVRTTIYLSFPAMLIALEPFSCVTGSDGLMYLNNAPHIRCSLDDSEWMFMMILSIPFSILYVLCIPLYLIRAIVKNIHNFQLYIVKASLGPLYLQYEDSYAWFEILVILRKVFVALVAKLLTNHPLFQSFLLFVITCLQIVVQAYTRPNVSSIVDYADCTAGVLGLFVLMVGVQIQAEHSGDTAADLGTTASVLILLWYITVIVGMGWEYRNPGADVGEDQKANMKRLFLVTKEEVVDGYTVFQTMKKQHQETWMDGVDTVYSLVNEYLSSEATERDGAAKTGKPNTESSKKQKTKLDPADKRFICVKAKADFALSGNSVTLTVPQLLQLTKSSEHYRSDKFTKLIHEILKANIAFESLCSEAMATECRCFPSLSLFEELFTNEVPEEEWEDRILKELERASLFLITVEPVLNRKDVDVVGMYLQVRKDEVPQEEWTNFATAFEEKTAKEAGGNEEGKSSPRGRGRGRGPRRGRGGRGRGGRRLSVQEGSASASAGSGSLTPTGRSPRNSTSMEGPKKAVAKSSEVEVADDKGWEESDSEGEMKAKKNYTRAHDPRLQAFGKPEGGSKE